MKKFIAIVVMLCAVLFSSTASATADWVWIYSNDNFTVYVDNNSIRRDYNYSGYVFRAFTKWMWSQSHIDKYFRSKGEVPPKEFYNLSYSINLEYYKDENGIKYTATANSTCYTRDRKVIPEMSSSNDTLKWIIIPPDSVIERVFDTIRARVPN